MSDIRFNQWLHQSGTGGVSQDHIGNIGIGTTNPSIVVSAANTAVLNVGVITANNLFVNNAFNGDITGNVTGNISGATGTFSGNVDIADKIIHTGDTDTAMRFPADNTFAVDTAGTERLRITSAGLVGIGTDNPSGKLNIVGSDSQLLNLIQNSGDLAIRLNDRGVGSAYIKVPDNTSGSLTFETGGSERLRITSDGKVGINTNAATARLDISHPNTEKGLVVRSRYGNIATAMVKFDSDPDSNGGDGNVLHLHGGSSRTDSEILHIDSTGVGDIFDIRGDGRTIVYKQLELQHSSNVAKIIFNEYGANDIKAQIEMDQVSGSSGQLIFRTQDSGTLSERVRIHSNGSVTKPNNPAFLVGRTGGNQTFTLGTFPFNVARINAGNCWNTSTYKFTAPTAGIYYFFGQVYYNSGDGDFRVAIRKTSSGSAIQLCTAACDTNGSDESLTISIMESLSVGDTIELYSDQNTGRTCFYNINQSQYGAHTYFMGYLVG